MSTNWDDLATAVACRVEFERRCKRENLLDEGTVVRFAAEQLHATWNGTIRVGVPHAQLKGRFVDLTGSMPRSDALGLVLEAKWLPASGGTRQFLREVAVDNFRLQHFTSNVRQGASRLLLVAGIRQRLDDELFNRTVRTGGSRAKGLDVVLTRSTATAHTKMHIRNCAGNARAWLRKCQRDLGANLPSTYDVRLATMYETSNAVDACVVYVWETKRPKRWTSFDPEKAWGTP